MNGWVKLHNKFLNWEWIDYPEMVSVFIYLLLTSNYEDKEWHGQIIKRGQTIIGREKLSKTLGISQQSLRTCLKRLKLTNEITIKPTNKYTIITIIKYDEYQFNDKKLTNKLTNRLTNKEPTTNQQLTTPKEYKNIRNKEDILSSVDDGLFYFKDKLSEMFKSQDRRMPIIAYYWSIKGVNYENKEQYSSAIKRELKPAGLLKGYSNERIKEVCQWLKDNSDFKWTLESVHKYIDDDLKKIEKGKMSEDDIINNILKN